MSVIITVLVGFFAALADSEPTQYYAGAAQSTTCVESSGLDLSQATLVQNNLGGLGPDSGAAEMRFENITVINGMSVDCVITNTSTYDRGTNLHNKLKDSLLRLVVACGTFVDLQVSFVDHETGNPVMLERFYFSAFDLDTAHSGKGAEWIRLDSLQAYYTTNSSEIRVRQGGRNKHTFRSSTRGRGNDNPKDPFNLTQEQADRTVAFLFTHKSQFSIKVGVKKRARLGGGRVILLGGKSSVTCAATAGGHLSQNDFAETVVLNWPGTYYLTEDIMFEPYPSRKTEVRKDLLPKVDSEKYPQLGGYFLGFFAAVVIQAPGVTFDCQGHSISMSPNFHKRQRFFSIFELASKPFVSATGPPQFSNGLLSPGDPFSAYNVTIQNCRLGLSSHHGIHGNNNYGVVLRNLQISAFEVGGIHLNGASKVVMEDIDIGPSLKSTFSAELSQAIFLDHILNTLLKQNNALFQARKELNITLRGRTMTTHRVLLRFRRQLRRYLDNGSGKLKDVFNSKDASDSLPDGSAVYGIVLHKTGIAVNEFGACGASETLNSSHHSEDVVLRGINIHDLAVRAEQWTRTVINGKQLMGPAGDVFRLTQASKNGSSSYKGNVFMDAQLAVGALKNYAVSEGISPDESYYYFGGAHMPDQVLGWASNSWSREEQDQWIQGLVQDNAFECFGDAMSHVNKGAVGMRLAHVYNSSLTNVNISSITNTGTDDADPRFCKSLPSPYGGKDVHGLVIENSDVDFDDSAMGIGGVRIDAATLISKNGGQVASVSHFNTRRLQLDTDMNLAEVIIPMETQHATTSYIMV